MPTSPFADAAPAMIRGGWLDVLPIPHGAKQPPPIPMPTSPFADAAPAMIRGGWLDVLPIPHGAKQPPPIGFTGGDPAVPTPSQIEEWRGLEGPRNIAVRLPDDVIGIDVDSAAPKVGAATLADLEARLGPLPDAPRSTAREDDGVGGIRLYAVPEGLSWEEKAGADIDIIRHGHRYLLVAPSLHPGGGIYRWLGDSGEGVEFPNRADIPVLPEEWVLFLQKPEGSGLVNTDRVAAFLDGLDDSDPSPSITRILADFEADLDGVDRHGAMLRTVEALVEAGTGRAFGARGAILLARAAFIAIKGDREGSREYDRALAGSVARLDEGLLTVYTHGDRLTFGTAEQAAALVVKPPGAGRTSHTAEDVLGWFLERYRVGRSTDGLVFAVPTAGTAPRIAREVRGMRSTILRAYREDHRAATGRGVVLGRETLSNALDAASAYAEDSEPEDVAIRAAVVNDRSEVVLDLGDASGTLVRVSAAGWHIVPADDTAPLFRRSEATQPLPAPTRGGSLDTLRDLLDLNADDARWLQIRGWLVGSLFASAPRPLLWATGPQGSGKSTRARMVLSLVEPTGALGKEPGRNERDDSTAARGRFLVSYDNITTVSQGTSDWLCRLVTGVTDDRRQLYSDDGLRPVTYRRSGVVTSITLPPGLRPDALERVTIVGFDRVPDERRRPESVLWDAFEKARPAILGALLDEAALVLQHLPSVVSQSRSWPRMADYAQVLAALDLGLGIGDDHGHRAAYVGAVDGALADAARDDPFAGAVIDAVDSARGHIRRPAGQLVDIIARAHGGLDSDLPKWWPLNPRALISYLKRSEETLRHAGVVVTYGKTNGARFVELAASKPRDDDRDGRSR